MNNTIISFGIAIGAFTAILSNPAIACNQVQARSMLETGMSTGLIETFSRMNNTSTVHFRQSVWDRLDRFERLGVFGTIECVIAGPGNAVTSIQAVNERGRIIATYNGRTGRMTVR